MQQTAAVDAHNQTAAAGASSRKRQRIPIASVQDYEETCLLGAGSFGVVTKARHRGTGQTIAIKRRHHLLSTRDDDDARSYSNNVELLREARMLHACWGVPFLVGYHGLARDRATTDDLCLLMEHVAGPSLRDYLHRRRRRRPLLPEPTVRAAMWQLLTCARAMHDRGVIHRDIKPSNILVGGDHRAVKICDLGLAIRTSSDPPPRVEARAGTLAYMAPEVLLGRTDCHDDARVDAWSLGCVMAELVGVGGGGRRPPVFDGGGDEVGQLWAIYEVLDTPDGHEHDGLREMFPEETLSREGFEVLSGLLAFDAENRLTADAALKMPWFDNVGALELPKEEEQVAVTASAAVHKKKRLRLIAPPPLAKMVF